VATSELSHPKATGTALGVIGAFSGIGSVFAGFPLATLTDLYGWNIFGATLFFSSIMMVLTLTLLKRLPSKSKED
jgi:sugar phosphate permease